LFKLIQLENIDIIENFGNKKNLPITGGPIQSSNGSYLYSCKVLLMTIEQTTELLFYVPLYLAIAKLSLLGKSPSKTSWWTDYKVKLAQWAVQFKENQPDV
jgi:mannan endo-1,4-beta-mannosidase